MMNNHTRGLRKQKKYAGIIGLKPAKTKRDSRLRQPEEQNKELFDD